MTGDRERARAKATRLGARARRAGAALAAVLAAGLPGCGADDAEVAPLHGPAFAPEDRPDTPGTALQFRFDAADLVQTFASASGAFLVHFARVGRNAVPERDADGAGVPDFVEEVAAVYDEVLLYYRDELGFRAPRSDEALADNGGDGRFDVYLVDFAGVGDGVFRVDRCGPDNDDTCTGFMTQENDYRGYGYPSTLVANRVLGSHELFHAVQAAYDVDQGSVMGEGTAVQATESFDSSLRDFENLIDGYLANPNRSLDVPPGGPVDPFSYGSAIFFQFLEERYGDGMIRSLWERVENGAGGQTNPVWFEQLGPLLEAQAQTTFAGAFVEFATWNLFTGSFADPARSYAAGAGYGPVKVENVGAPYSARLRAFYASAQYYRAASGGRTAMTAALATPASAPEENDGLVLLVAAQRGAAYGEVTRVEDPTAGTQVLDMNGEDSLVVIAVNGTQQGDSRRPTLCIGTQDEVAACRDAVDGGAGGGGGGGGAGGSGGEPAPADRPAAGEADGGCGCRLGPSAAVDPTFALGLSALAFYLRRRRAHPRAMAAAQSAP